MTEEAAVVGAGAADVALARLRARAGAWSALGPLPRAALLDEVQRDLLAVSERWVAAGLTAKGLEPGGMGEAEEWLFLTTALRSVRLLRDSLAARAVLRSGHRPRFRGPVWRLPTGQVVARVFPGGWLDRLVYRGLTGEVWFEPGAAFGMAWRRQGRACREPSAAPVGGRPGEVAAVLGAGNASMLPVVDTLHQLFVEGRVVALKANPVNAYLEPLLEAGLGALMRRGYLRLVSGGAEVGASLCRHPAVDAVHLTGSHATFSAVTAGAGGAVPRKGSPAARPITAELGNVSPVLVVPGPWTARELREQAVRLATWLVANAGFGCLTPRVLVQHREWPLRGALLEALGRALAEVPTRSAYYPGAAARHAAFVAAHPRARLLGPPGAATPGHLPWTLVPAVDPTQVDDICFRREAFCGLVAETALSAPTPTAFLDRAVAFANGTLWGTLCATLLVHPTSAADPALAAAVVRAVAGLRYGTVTVNAPAFAAYYLQVTPWGAFPEPDPARIESGVGKTANSLLLERVQKSVVRGPFAPRPDPLTAAARRPHVFARRLACYEGAPAPLARLAALRGLFEAALRE